MPYFLTLSGSRNKFSKAGFLLRTIDNRLDAQGVELRVIHAAHAADLEHSSAGKRRRVCGCAGQALRREARGGRLNLYYLSMGLPAGREVAMLEGC